MDNLNSIRLRVTTMEVMARTLLKEAAITRKALDQITDSKPPKGEEISEEEIAKVLARRHRHLNKKSC